MRRGTHGEETLDPRPVERPEPPGRRTCHPPATGGWKFDKDPTGANGAEAGFDSVAETVAGPGSPASTPPATVEIVDVSHAQLLESLGDRTAAGTAASVTIHHDRLVGRGQRLEVLVE